MNIKNKIKRKFPKFSLFLRLCKENLYIFSKVSRSSEGFLFCGNRSMIKGEFEKEELKLVKILLKKTDIFINIGANVGYYCCVSLSKGNKTIAFEPLLSNLNYLYRNINVNGWDNDIEIYPLGLGEDKGLGRIFGAGTGASLIKGYSDIDDQYSRFIAINTLDNIVGNRLENSHPFILVDIEGSELSMLKGANKILNGKNKPIWMVEICISENQPTGVKINPYLRKTFELFWSYGYKSYMANNELKLITERDIDLCCNSEKNILEVHNFIFIDKEKKELFL